MTTEAGPKLKGAFMKDARNWARTAYGADAWENARGRAVIRYLDGSPALLDNLSHHLPTALIWVLEQSGARDPVPTITRRDVVGDKLVFEVSVTYRAG